MTRLALFLSASALATVAVTTPARAQNPPPPPPPPPTSQERPAPRHDDVPPGTAGPVITVTGCVDRMPTRHAPLGGDQAVTTYYVLHQAADMQMLRTEQRQTSEGTGVGSLESQTGRMDYGLISANQEALPEHHLGERVEITGSLRSSVGLGPTPSGLETPNPVSPSGDAAPPIIVRSIKTVSADCAGSKH
jgi:hypothetical protein